MADRPYRKIVSINADGSVVLSCGHVVYNTRAGVRARCPICPPPIDPAEAKERDEAAQQEFTAFNDTEASDG